MGQRPKLLSFAGPADQHFKNPARLRPLFVGGASGEDDDDDDSVSDGSTVPVGRYLKLKNRMQAADRRASTAEARVAELEPIAAKVPDLEKQVENGSEQIKKLRIDNAFLTSDVKWVDAEAALRLVDLSDVEIKDDGTVKGLKEALAALAEKKPYLVQKDDEEKGKKGKRKGKASDEDEDDDDESDEDEDDADDADEDEDEDDDEDTSGASGRRLTSVQGGASGTSTGSGKRKRKVKGPSDDEIMRKYRI